MVVNDLNVHWPFAGPHEADTKLVIDPNAVLTRSVSNESLQSVPRRDPEILERRCPIEHREFAHRDGLDVDEALDPLATEQILCFWAGKGHDGHIEY